MKVDVLIIGTGQAGVPLATRLAAAGKTVAIAERSELGGTCVNYGCTPTKTMIASARAAHVARNAARLGVHVDGVRVDFAEVVARKGAVVRTWREGVEKRLAKAADNLTLLRGQARFVGPREVEVGGARHQGDVVVINVGARSAKLDIPGMDSVPWLDSARALDLRTLPRHLVVLGGGYIGCELGQMFRRFGSEVTVIDPSARLLATQDEEVSTEIENVFRGEGITLVMNARTQRVAGDAQGGVVLTLDGGKEVRGSHLLVAAGRRPNTDDLGCDAAGIRLDPRGTIAVDEHYQTSLPGVYAVGDVIDEPQFTHTSWDDHRILFEHLAGRPSRERTSRHIPFTVFTDPQVAGVGLNEREAKRRGVPYELANMPFGWIARAREIDEKAGVVRVLLDPATERILGAQIVGAEAGELIHLFVGLIEAGASARAIVDAEFVHPTFAEGLQSAVMSLKRYALS